MNYKFLTHMFLSKTCTQWLQHIKQ